MTANPTRQIEKPGVRCKPKTIVTYARAMGLLGAPDPADRPTFAIAFLAGLRKGEVVGLRVEEVDLARG